MVSTERKKKHSGSLQVIKVNLRIFKTRVKKKLRNKLKGTHYFCVLSKCTLLIVLATLENTSNGNVQQIFIAFYLRFPLFTKSGSDVTQRLKVVPSSVAYDIAGDYFQVLRHITAPAAQMVRQQSSLIITPEWEYSS